MATVRKTITLTEQQNAQKTLLRWFGYARRWGFTLNSMLKGG